ncbi:restriction endonuclease subunit S [Parapedobacter sp. ISTM3]|uniref:restriction endonuclease subunit S n=1 Tax=Parapedobacter sp. ISTM3 TaxID=2800130 RepID=UPI0019074948|nr:restriction endonuclease subunit S [Parapedobacter sp. ISTM3]MBK1439682.1 restriction endonuclease subunit S [Parapedobacter sp. ISTM3]
MSEWKTYKLGEFAELRKEQIIPNGKEQPYIGLEHIEQQSLRLNGVGSSNSVISNKFKFYSGDILYGKLRPYFRKVYKPKFEGVCSTDIYVIRNKKLVDKDYLFYLVATEEFTNIANSGSSGTRMPRADWKQLEKSEWNLPDLPTQKQIAQILSSLDDKIELNLQMNQTLEAMAQAIFKEWFVNFNFPGFDGELVDGLPKGWSKITLDEIAKVKNGYAFKGTDFINEGVPVIKIKNVKPNKILLNDLSYVSREVADKAIKYVINQDDILITMSGNRMNGTPDTWVGKVALFQRQGEYLLNQRVSVIDLTPDYSHLKYYLTILLSSIEFQNYFISSATSSGGQANISPALIYSTEIILPDLETSQKFYLTIKSFYNKILENELQIESLTQTRDTLLPKLMSGNIAVMNA